MMADIQIQEIIATLMSVSLKKSLTQSQCLSTNSQANTWTGHSSSRLTINSEINNRRGTNTATNIITGESDSDSDFVDGTVDEE